MCVCINMCVFVMHDILLLSRFYIYFSFLVCLTCVFVFVTTVDALRVVARRRLYAQLDWPRRQIHNAVVVLGWYVVSRTILLSLFVG